MTPFPRPDYRTLSRYTPDRRPVSVDLSDNTNLWGTHPAALERVRAAGPDDLARYPELYADRLREAVADKFGVDTACVTTGCGSDDVLDSAFRAAGGGSGLVSYAAPTFSMIDPLARMNGLPSRAVPWPDALDDPGRLLERHPSLVYVCRPNNPTGEQAPEAWVGALLDQVGSDGPLVVLDEAYADFAKETWLPRAPEHPRLLVARTASKAYGLAGLRTGFAVASEEVALEIEKSRGPYKVTRLGVEAAAAAVRDADGWMAATVEVAIANRERLARELTRRGLTPLDSRSNFLLFPALSESAREDALRIRGRDVAVRPFSDIPGMGEGLRVTVGPWPLMEAFLAALDAELAAREARS